MIFYNLKKEEVDALLADMGYNLPEDYLEKNLRFYLARTSHGSTLSRVVHAQLANMVGDESLSWELYYDALESDYNDIQGGTTAEGIHAGVMAGTIMIAITTFAGIDLRGNLLSVNPSLPERWKAMKFGLKFKGVDFQFEITNEKVSVVANKATDILIAGKAVNLKKGEVIVVR